VTTIHEIQQFIWLETPLGDGQALFLLDNGPHENVTFIVALQKDGQLKHFTSEQVKLCPNYTYGINVGDKKPD